MQTQKVMHGYGDKLVNYLEIGQQNISNILLKGVLMVLFMIMII